MSTRTAALSFAKRICFAAETLILTKSGHKQIEQIAVGDLVWSRSEHDVGEAAFRKVTGHACAGESVILEIGVATPDGRAETFRTTELHPPLPWPSSP